MFIQFDPEILSLEIYSKKIIRDVRKENNWNYTGCLS